jgi:small GTP-binding protein
MSILRSRVIVAGEPTVGKTQIVHQATKGAFNHNYMMTQGCEYNVKEVKLAEKGAYNIVELHLIDIAGQNIFKEITFDLMCKANQVVLVYDCTNPDSFQLLRTWYEQIKAQNNGKSFSGVVISNKADLDTRQQV